MNLAVASIVEVVDGPLIEIAGIVVVPAAQMRPMLDGQMVLEKGKRGDPSEIPYLLGREQGAVASCRLGY